MKLKRLPGHILKISKLAHLLGLKQSFSFATYRYIGPGVTMPLHIKGIPHPVYVRSKGKDINCLWQIFGNRDCHIDLSPQPQVIIDGGAHVGLASVYFSNQFPNATIIAIEPEPSNCEIARKNLQYYPNVRLVQSGLWGKDSRLVIENPEAESWAFRVREVPRR